MANKKKLYRVVGVSSVRVMGSKLVPRGIKSFARELETQMNALKGDGYAVSLAEQENGTLIMGRCEEEDGGGSGEDEHYLCDRSRYILQTFLHAIEHKKATRFAAAAKEKATLLLSPFTGEELRTASAELLREANAHAKEHTDPERELVSVMRALAAVIDAHVQSNLQ